MSLNYFPMKRRSHTLHRAANAFLATGCFALSQMSHAATVTGVVVDGATGQPLTGVEVMADGVATGAMTDATGKFKVDIPAGEKQLGLKKDGYTEQSLGKVEIAAEGEQALPNAKLYAKTNEDVVMLDALSVEGDVVKNSVVMARQNADIAVDVLTASDFGKFTGTDIADVAVRVPGISTTSQGSFAVVRGLAERYNPVMLDGIVLPSSDPERQSPELDIFPARLVDAIVISKSYTSNLPGTASGAAIDLRTKPLPEKRFLQVQVGIRTDDDFLSNEAFLGSATGGDWDLLGFGKKDRHGDAPSTNPDRLAYTQTSVNGTKFENFPLGSRISFTYEDLLVLDQDSGRAVGFGISAGQDRTASSESGQKVAVTNAISTLGATTGKISDVTGFKSNEYIESELETRLGTLASVGYAFNKNHQIGGSFFWSQIGSDNHKREFNGFEMSGGSAANLGEALAAIKTDPTTLDFGSVNIDNSFGLMGKDEIYYRQRSLYDAQIKGEHKFDGNIPSEVTWVLADINARQDEPDFYTIPYQYTPDKSLYRGNFGGGEGRYSRYWRDTEESTLSGRVDGKFQFENEKLVDTELTTGYYFDRSNRDYNEASYQLSSGSVNGASLNNFFSNLSGYSGSILVPGAATPTFATGERTLDAFYGSALISLLKDKPKVKKLDLLVGARLESYNMESAGRGAIGNSGSGDFYSSLDLAEGGSGAGFVPGAVYTGTVEENKLLPAVGLNYSPKKNINVRLSASQTTARPSFREMGSYFTVDQVIDENVHGNKNLKTSDVTNYDFRIEYFFPESTDLLAFSLFKKDVKSPIERVNLDVTSIGSVSTWRNNANDAEVLGAEFEFAKNLEFLGGPGEYFTLGANYTYLAATVDRDPSFEAAQISATGIDDTRPLYDQPDFIANAYVTFDYRPWRLSTTLSYFAIGDVLQKVSRNTWDTYVAANDRFDATIVKKIGKNFSIRASARNLLDPTRELIADPDATSSKVVLRSFRDGRSYTITGVYEF